MVDYFTDEVPDQKIHRAVDLPFNTSKEDAIAQIIDKGQEILSMLAMHDESFVGQTIPIP